MRETCHRCGGDLPDFEAAGDMRSPFCPHCGAPQLLLSDYSEPLSTGLESTDASGAPSTGTLPPPRPNRIDWPMALRGAIFVSLVAAALSLLAAGLPNFTVIGSVWVVSASLTTLALYQRRRPLAAMNAGVGARIGLLVGIMLVSILAVTLSAGLCIARFKLGAMADFDAKMALGMKAQVDQFAATGSIPAEKLAFFNSPQFRTGCMLFSFWVILFAVLLISVFGGAVGGLLRTRRISRKA
ncbi:hypothetical protein HDF16_003337 [Granulicella aggregans]|uniref:DUF4199 domain-containing protein n=1 Tax=Granulicella aggregans TaxID=474949 RepID=A0A7W8E438_9BACT|nr:hypothetical protein [Granulicella aggregans]MBB5058623.1 hypothetical protein [Granulicella aggregans]